MPDPSLKPSTSLFIPIVAIGASAGGLEAVSELLANLSTSAGMSYVYIQHWEEAPNDRNSGNTTGSDVVSMLSRVTTMPVLEAEAQMTIQANHVYVIASGPQQSSPPRPNQLASQPALTVEAIEETLTFVIERHERADNQFTPDYGLPIDRFFISLANCQRAGSVAILLSGTASDGTLGMRAIRAAGGFTFAQDETARFQSMPRSAIVEGLVDRVMPPADIARELELLSHQSAVFDQIAGADALEKFEQPDLSTTDDDAADADSAPTGPAGEASVNALSQASDADIRVIIQILRKATGADFNHYKMTTIRRRIVRRMLLLRLETLSDYAQYLLQHNQETRALYDDLLINVTTFFRDADTMHYLKQELLPQLIRNKTPYETLRIWVPACSTGQEAFSIAMLLLEVIDQQAAHLTIQLFATDLSEPAVAKARLGAYTPGEVMDVSPRRLQRFFTKIDDHYRINKEIRDLCIFAPHNLLKDPPFSRLDMISCRNLLIYLDAHLQQRAIATFHYALNAGGYLLLGKSEAVGASSPFFSSLQTNYKLYIRKSDSTAGRALFDMNTRYGEGLSAGSGRDNADQQANPNKLNDMPEQTGPKSGNANSTARQNRSARPVSDLDKTVENILLNQYVPASVVVNTDLDIVRFRGETSLFMEPAPGRASLNLLKMARPALVFELRNIIHKAEQSGQPARRTGLEVKIKNQTHYMAIEAVPFSTETEDQLYLVIFEEVTAIVTTENDATDIRSLRIKQLEEELATLRNDMRTIIEEQEIASEELQSANEEIISSNEELQSINEELETSKEEIESTNEELLTTNQELQVRNDQLSESYEFAEAIFGTIREATLVLTTDLRVKSANPIFYSLFGLTESEAVGRLIYELANRQWDSPQLRSLLTDVATRDIQVHNFELVYTTNNADRKVLSLNARRVVRQQEAILLAIEDVTEDRRLQELLKEREAWFHQIADNAPALIWVADADGRCTFLNNVWLDFTGRQADEVAPRNWLQSLHPDDQHRYEELFDAHFISKEPFQIEYQMRQYDGSYHWMLENAKPTFASDGRFTGFIGSATNVHQQKERNAELDRLVAERTARLTQLAAQLRSVLNGVPASIMLMEPVKDDQTPDALPSDFTTVIFNQLAQDLMGQSSESIVDKTLLEVFPESKENGLFDAYVEVYKSGAEVYKELTITIADEPLTIAFYINRRAGQAGLVVTALDISSRKKAEQQVQQTAAAIQGILESSPASISVLKAVRSNEGIITDFRLLFGNQQFAQLVNIPPEQLTQLNIDQLTGTLWQEATLSNFAHVVETGEPYSIEQHQSDNRWVAFSVSKQDDGVMLVGIDLTEMKQMQQQEEQLLFQVRESGDTVRQLALLQQQVQTRGKLLRTSSHDLRGSLGIIQGAAGLFAFADSDEERAQMLDVLQRNVQETTRLITELLDYSRLEAGQHTTQQMTFDAGELLHRMCENVRVLVERKGLTMQLIGDDTFLVAGDPLNSLRIAQNLVLNALKYTSQGTITVRWGDQGADEWFFSIEDTGAGMEQAVADRLSTETTETKPEVDSLAVQPEIETLLAGHMLLANAPGEGIGLIIVRQLCDLLQGRLTVISKPGEGSVFRVVLPRHT